jgi:hypothetical protein
VGCDVSNAYIFGGNIGIEIVQQVGKGPFGIHIPTIRINILTKQGDFLVALVLN